MFTLYSRSLFPRAHVSLMVLCRPANGSTANDHQIAIFYSWIFFALCSLECKPFSIFCDTIRWNHFRSWGHFRSFLGTHTVLKNQNHCYWCNDCYWPLHITCPCKKQVQLGVNTGIIADFVKCRMIIRFRCTLSDDDAFFISGSLLTRTALLLFSLAWKSYLHQGKLYKKDSNSTKIQRV